MHGISNRELCYLKSVAQDCWDALRKEEFSKIETQLHAALRAHGQALRAEGNLGDEYRRRAAGRPTLTDCENRRRAKRQPDWRVRALMLIARHPDWATKRIIEETDVPRSTFYHDETIKRALSGRKSSKQPPSGRITSGTLEADGPDFTIEEVLRREEG